MTLLFIVFYLLVALGFVLAMVDDKDRPDDESVGFAVFCGLIWPCFLGSYLHNKTKGL